MSSVNRAIIVGNLGRDPEVRALTSGEKVVNLSIATSENWKGKDGNKQERTEWHRVTIFNPHLAEVAEKFLRKGSKVYLEGAIQTRKYTDKDGAEKYATEIVLQKYRGELVMLDGKDDSAQRPTSGGANTGYSGGDLDDSIPFSMEWR
jgi:single-strand DNA-binding protein